MGKKAREKQARRERQKTRPIFVDEIDGDFNKEDIFLQVNKDGKVRLVTLDQNGNIVRELTPLKFPDEYEETFKSRQEFDAFMDKTRERLKKDIQGAFEKGLKNLFKPPNKNELRGQIDEYLGTACASNDVQE